MAATKNGSGAKKTPAKGSTRSKGTTANKAAELEQAKLREASRSRVVSIVLLVVAVFMLAVVFIDAGSVWGALRSFVFGLFGITAYILPLALIAVDVMVLIGKMTSHVRFKVIEAFTFLALIVSMIHIVKYDANTAAGFGEQLASGYNEYRLGGITTGSGFFGAFIGGAFLAITGGNKAAAGIIGGLLLFLVFMLFSGATLINLYHMLKKPVQKAVEYTDDKIGEFREAAEKHRSEDDELDELAAEAEKVAQKRRLSVGRKHPDKPGAPVESEKSEKAESGSDIDIVLDEAPPADDYGLDSIFAVSEKAKADASPHRESRNEFLRLVTGESPEGKKSDEPDISPDKTASKSAQRPKSVIAAVEKKPVELEIETATEVYKDYILPPIECLTEPSVIGVLDNGEEQRQNAKKIVETLRSFGVETKIVDVCRSPSVTRYELQPAPGVKISKITSLSDDLALNLASAGVRIEAPIPNKSAVGIEVPNRDRVSVTLRELIDTPQYKAAKSKLNVALGKDIQGTATYADLSKMPHLLIAGTTGSGKSVCLNTMIVSLLYNARPDEVKLVMIDPKTVEFTVYTGIPHLLVPVVTDPRKASGALAWAVTEMEKRYKLFSELGVRNLQGYNDHKRSVGEAVLPQIVIFIDELSDLMMVASNEVESSICRIAQKARAAGMHLVVATQRPSVDVITGLIKANIPSRLALSVSSQIDSRTILDSVGAEKLLGNGDMLFCPVGMAKPVRLQGAYISDEEIEDVVEFVKEQGNGEYDSEVIEEIERQAAMDTKKKKNGFDAEAIDSDDTDEMFPKAVEVVIEAGMASTTLLQRKLKLGYARAARIIDELSEKGIIGPFEGSKPRKVLITRQQWYEMSAMASDRPRQVTYEDIISDGSEMPERDDSSDSDELSSGSDHNYFGGYTAPSDFEDVYSNSYTEDN